MPGQSELIAVVPSLHGRQYATMVSSQHWQTRIPIGCSLSADLTDRQPATASTETGPCKV